MSTQQDGRLLRAAIALQYMQEHFGSVDFQVPNFALVGMQSSGKSRMLSYFAGRKIGGAEKSKIGTRCPVVYEFQLGEDKAKFGTMDKMEEIDPKNIHIRISDHMRQLERDGFSDEALVVKISGPTSLNAVLIDLPGIMPTNASSEGAADHNPIISKMIKRYVAKPNTIPLVMTCIPNNLDMTFLNSDLTQLLSLACETPDQLTSRAIILASRLDSVPKTLRRSNLKEFLDTVTKLGFDAKGVYFFSLVPELLDSETKAPLVDGNSGSYEALTDYFENIAPKKEADFLPKYIARMELDSHEFHFGVQQVKTTIETTLINAMGSNLMSALEKMRESWRQLARQFQELQRTEDLSEFKKRVREYATLATAMLGGTALNKPDQILNAMQNAERRQASNHSSANTIELGDETFAEQLVQSLARKFDDERALYANTNGAEMMHLQFMLEPSVVSNLRKPSHGRTYNFFENLNGKLSGEAAVWRLISLFAFAVMTRDLKTFSADEIINYGNFTDMNGTRGFTTAHAIHKMVQELRIKASAFKELIKWCAWLYSCQAPMVCKELRKRVHFLDSYPKLIDHLDQLLTNAYTESFENVVHKLTEAAMDSVDNRFATLKLDELTASINLLGCVGLTRSLLQEPTYHMEAETTSIKELNTKLEEIVNAFGEQGQEPIVAALQLAQRTLVAPKSHIQHTFDFFSEVIAVSPHEFASLEGLKLHDLTREEVRGKVGALNDTAHMVTRYCCGMVFLEVTAQIEKGLIKTGQNLYNDIQVKVMTQVSNLLDQDRCKPFLRRLMMENNTVGQKTQLIEKMKVWQDTAVRLNECCKGKGACTPLETTRTLALLSRLEQEVKEDEQATGAELDDLLPSASQQGDQIETTHSDTYDDEDYDNNAALIDRLRRENVRLKEENGELRRKLQLADQHSQAF